MPTTRRTNNKGKKQLDNKKPLTEEQLTLIGIFILVVWFMGLITYLIFKK